MLTGIFEEPLRVAMLQAGTEALSAVTVPMAGLVAVGVAIAVGVTMFRRDSDTPVATPRLQKAA